MVKYKEETTSYSIKIVQVINNIYHSKKRVSNAILKKYKI